MFLRSLRAFLFLTLLIFPVLAQRPFAPPSPRARAFDVQHYVISSKLDFVKKQITGQTTIRVKPLANGFQTMELDAAKMNIESVALTNAGASGGASGGANGGNSDGGGEAKPLQFKTTDEKLIVTLDRAYSADSVIAVTIKYTVLAPKKGVYFIDKAVDRGGRLINPRQAWTHGEAEESHYWFPSYDYPDDKATSEQYLTVPATDTAIANGELLDTRDNGDGTKTWHYKISVPHAIYVTSFIAGEYVKIEGKYNDTPLSYYVYPGEEHLVPLAFGKTAAMMEIFEKMTGVKFPFNKYDQTMVAQFDFAGMENITATTLADSELYGAELKGMRPQVEDLVSHELAHSWFGNLVTCKTWSQLWLNEGFASYMEAVFREQTAGRKTYLDKIRDDRERVFSDEQNGSRQHPLVNSIAVPDNDLFDATTYQKGSVVIYMLRETVGDEAFWKAVNLYLTRHKFGSVETDDLQDAMEDAYGKDLDWFFNQWVYGAGYPELRVKSSYDSKKKNVVLEIEQKQKKRDDSVAAFILPLEIEIDTARGLVKKKLNFDQTKETFNIPVKSEPTKIVFDKDDKIILKKAHFSGEVPIENAR